MKFKHMFKRTAVKNDAVNEKKTRFSARKPEVPDGLMKKCNACKTAVFVEEVKQNNYICPHCQNYFRMHAYRRIQMIADPDSFEEWDKGLQTRNPLQFKGYEEKLDKLKEKTGLDEAVVTGKLNINGIPTVVAVCDGRFMMASMGEVVGEKITRAVEKATEEKLPIIIFACSGGARMQEGIVSLMQMAKTSAALKRHSDEGLLYISVLTDPTTGGVTASFAMLGDIILAEPGALIGFAGPRVIEQTIGQKLPEGFQRSEFLLEHGFIDAIVERKEMRSTLSKILDMHITKTEDNTEFVENKEQMQTAVENDLECQDKMSAWDHVQLARDKNRPTGKDYIQLLFSDFVEMHGDRLYRDDPAVIGGVAKFHGEPVTILVQEKGHGTKENIAHRFGMVSPEGYRKSLRLMKQAEKFNRPVICFVDTPGAFCGLEAEENGQGEAIARNLYELSGLKVPVLSVVIGEGGSGGALAFAVADEVWMMEHAIYSILSPEGFASILWKDSKRAKEAADVMKMTAQDLKDLGIIEQIIREEEPLTRENMMQLKDNMDEKINCFLKKYKALSKQELVQHRYKRFRNI
jgi:acyl-CoA carboxylase subunit beta